MAKGATWDSLHHGSGIGTGVMRHAVAGYAIAIDCAKEQGVDLPTIG
jgi:urocanate hydratase